MHVHASYLSSGRYQAGRHRGLNQRHELQRAAVLPHVQLCHHQKIQIVAAREDKTGRERPCWTWPTRIDPPWTS